MRRFLMMPMRFRFRRCFRYAGADDAIRHYFIFALIDALSRAALMPRAMLMLRR